MRAILRAFAIVLTVVLFLFAAVGSVRWAKRSSAGAQFLASAMILVLGMGGPVVHPPQQTIEEARQHDATKDAQSGDPPSA